MSDVQRKTLSYSIAQLMPHIIQGVHLDFMIKKAITQTQFLVMVAIYSNGRCPMNRLANNMQVTMPTMSGIVNRLVLAGYVRRVAAAEDRRQVVVELTPAGLQLIKEFQGAISQRWREILKGLNSEEVSSFARVIERMRETLRGKKRE